MTPRFAPERPGDVKHSQADTARMTALLGFEAQTRFEEGLRETIRWYE